MELIADIKRFSELFPDGKDGCEYGLEALEYELDANNPIVRVSLGHYSRDDISLCIVFEEAWYHSVMPESFGAFGRDDGWEGHAFLHYTRESVLFRFLSDHAMLKAYDDIKYDYSDLYHYCVACQNFNVDVIASQKPKFIINNT